METKRLRVGHMATIIACTKFGHDIKTGETVRINKYDSDDDSYEVDVVTGDFQKGMWVPAVDLQPISKK